MKISELKPGQGKVDIEIKIKSKSEIRVLQKFGKELKVANAVAEDDSGEIAITLWNNDAENVKAGDKVKITNGYVSEYNGAKQLTSGKFGKLEVVSPGGESLAVPGNPDSNAESSPVESEEQPQEKPAKSSKPKPAAKSKKSFDEDVEF